MEILQHQQNCPTPAEEKHTDHHYYHDNNDVQQSKQHAQLNINSSPPSSSSSPSHEFSFTISLHPPPQSTTGNAKIKSPPPYTAVDLSPADEIFFHGHLLPLHLLSHLPVSRRSSSNSPDKFTLPIKELMHNVDDDKKHQGDSTNINQVDHKEEKARVRKIKSKSFSIFVMPRKWRTKGHNESKDLYHDDENGTENVRDERDKRTSRFDLVKRYMRLVKPFFLTNIRRRRRREKQDKFLTYSFSGNLGVIRNSKTEVIREKRRGRHDKFLSAPASMSNSPTNSGPLVASGTVTPTKSSDSTMEELQAAIQAAIAHCKKSIAADDKALKLP